MSLLAYASAAVYCDGFGVGVGGMRAGLGWGDGDGCCALRCLGVGGVVFGDGGECWVDGWLLGVDTQRRVVVDDVVVLEG